MSAPLVTMVAYLAFAKSRSHYSTPKVADSVYFMGFLWTLWALIDVLVWKPQLTAAQLYIAFGYALTATTAGMFLRLGLLQFHRTLDEQQAGAVDTLDERVGQLLAELDACQKQLATFRGTSLFELSGHQAAFLEELKAHIGAVQKAADAFNKRVS
jgi:hypothetical protein